VVLSQRVPDGLRVPVRDTRRTAAQRQARPADRLSPRRLAQTRPLAWARPCPAVRTTLPGRQG
jgi:hypothetical protein